MMILSGIGAITGVCGALVLSRSLSSLLYGVQFYDPLALMIPPLLLLGVVAIATWIPAHRGATLDPTDALREQ